MKRRRSCQPVQQPSSAFAGFRFPPEVILLAVRWYFRFGLSYRDLEELLAERGIQVDHVTLFRWIQRFTPILADAAGPRRHAVTGRWFVDETYVKVSGSWHYVYRAARASLCNMQVGATLPAGFGSLPHCPVCQRFNKS